LHCRRRAASVRRCRRRSVRDARDDHAKAAACRHGTHAMWLTRLTSFVSGGPPYVARGCDWLPISYTTQECRSVLPCRQRTAGFGFVQLHLCLMFIIPADRSRGAVPATRNERPPAASGHCSFLSRTSTAERANAQESGKGIPAAASSHKKEEKRRRIHFPCVARGENADAMNGDLHEKRRPVTTAYAAGRRSWTHQ
jgi:hypothetical protein